MRKLLTIIFCLLVSASFAAHPGPSQWSLAGVASWAQILTASGTAIPTATTTFTIGDFYAQNTAGSTTVTLYRLCASGTTSLWHPFGGAAASSEGGATTLIELTDFPDTTGHDYEVLQHNTFNTFQWVDVPTAEELSSHVYSSIDAHGGNQTIGTNVFASGGKFQRIMAMNDVLTLNYYQVVVASQSLDVDGSYPALSPCSSTQAIGVFYGSGIWGEVSSSWVTIAGEALVVVASDSANIFPGDWVITSDTVPGHAMRASVAGDMPLPYDEAQRILGVCTVASYYESEEDFATYTQIILKGLR